LQEFNPLSVEEQQEMLQVMMQFIDPIALDDDTNNQNVAESQAKMDVDGEEGSSMKLDADACAALTHAIHAMKTFLMRSKGFVAGVSLFQETQNQLIVKYLQRITNILCYGVEYIFYPTESVVDLDHYQSWKQSLHLNVEEENIVIRSACSELLIQLAEIPGGQEILHKDLLPQIMSLTISTTVSSLQHRLGNLLSELAIKSTSIATFELIVSNLMVSILKSMNEGHVEVSHRLLEIITNCFPKDSSTAQSDKSAQAKAGYLSGVTTKCDMSPLVQLIAPFSRYVDVFMFVDLSVFDIEICFYVL
jgi:hypothetical protein